MAGIAGYYFIDWTKFPTGTLSSGPTFQLQTTFTANPGSDLLTMAANHLQVAAEVVLFTSTGVLPAPLVQGLIYRVLPDGLTNTTMKVASNEGWNPPPYPPAIDITDNGSGTHYVWIRPLDLIQTFNPGNVNTTTNIITFSSPHSLRVGNRVRFSSTGTLPAPLLANTDYFISTAGFTDSAFGLDGVDFTTGGTGTHSLLAFGGTKLQVALDGVLGDLTIPSAFGIPANDSFYFMAGETSVPIGQGPPPPPGQQAGSGAQNQKVIYKGRDITDLVGRAKRAAKLIENLKIVGDGVAGDPMKGFTIND